MQSIFGIGTVKLKDNSGTLQVRNAADDAFVKIQVATPTTDNDATPLIYVMDKAPLDIAGGRLGLYSGNPLAEGTAAETLYYIPCRSDRISLYDGTTWTSYSFSQLELAIPSTTNTLYDIFIYNNAGTLTLKAVAWTSSGAGSSTRAPSVDTTKINGVTVNSAATGERYLGTIKTTSVSGQCADNLTNRFVNNYYNRIERNLLKNPSGTWSYSTNTTRIIKGDATQIIEWVSISPFDLVDLRLFMAISLADGVSAYNYLALNSQSTAIAVAAANQLDNQSGGTMFFNTTLNHTVQPFWGYNYACGLENVSAGTAEFFSYGVNCGIAAKLMM